MFPSRGQRVEADRVAVLHLNTAFEQQHVVYSKTAGQERHLAQCGVVAVGIESYETG